MFFVKTNINQNRLWAFKGIAIDVGLSIDPTKLTLHEKTLFLRPMSEMIKHDTTYIQSLWKRMSKSESKIFSLKKNLKFCHVF